MKEISGCRIEKDGKLLLLHRIKWAHWELPGGKIDAGETPQQAAIREAKEEIGCDVKIIKELKPVVFEFKAQFIKSYQFEAQIVTGTPSIKESDTFDDIRYVDIKKEKYISPNLMRK